VKGHISNEPSYNVLGAKKTCSAISTYRPHTEDSALLIGAMQFSWVTVVAKQDLIRSFHKLLYLTNLVSDIKGIAQTEGV
jgi:hypothetical protein